MEGIGLLGVPLVGAAVAVIFSPRLALVMVAATVFLVSLANRRWSLYAAILLLPIIHFKPFAGMKLSEMFMLAMFISTLLLVLAGKLKLKAIRPVGYLLLFIAFSVLSFVNSIGIRKDEVLFAGLIYAPNIISINWILRYITIAGILFTVPSVIRTERIFRNAVRIHIFSGTTVSIFGLMLVALFLLGKQVSIPICRSFGDYAGMWGFRLAGTAFEPAGFANYLLAVIPITLAAWIGEQQNIKTELTLFFAFAIQCFAMFFTLSSGGWISLGLAILLLLYVGRHGLVGRKRLQLVVIGLLVAISLSCLCVRLNLSANRLGFVLVGKFMSDTPGKVDRLATARILLRMVKDHPIMGIGPGNFPYHMASYAQGEAGLSVSGYKTTYPATWKANNDYLTVAAETGIVGLIIFALFIVALLRSLVHVAKSVKGLADDYTILGIACSIVALMLQASVSFTILNPFIWVLSGLAFGYWSIVAPRDENRH